MYNQSPLSVIVVGGGIGGLTTAIALRRSGHSVTVYEKSSFANEVGAAVTLASNAGYVLSTLGLTIQSARLSLYNGNNVVAGDTFTPMRSTDMSNYAEKYKYPNTTAYRPDLQKALVEFAETSDGPGPPCTLHADCPVVDFEPEEGAVRLADGSKKTADLVIAADGVHSVAMDRVHGRRCKVEATNTTVIRFLLRTEDVLADPETAPLLDAGRGYSTFNVGTGDKRWLVRYWCDNYERQNFAMYTVQDEAGADAQELRFHTDRETLRRELEGFHPSLLRVCGMSNEVLPLWRCARRETLKRYSRGRLVVVGDAAHAMLPHIGQGAVSAILDAGALGVLFKDIPDGSAETVRERLELFDTLRPPRASAAQLYSDLPYWFDTIAVQKDKVLGFIPEKELPDPKTGLHDWDFGYDVLEASENLLRQHLSRRAGTE